MIALFRADPVTTDEKREKSLDTGKGRTLKNLVHHELHQKIAASTAFSLRASSGRRLKND